MATNQQLVLLSIEVDFVAGVIGSVGVGPKQNAGVLDALLEFDPAAEFDVGLLGCGHQHERSAPRNDVHDALVAAAPFAGMGTPVGVGRDEEFFLWQLVAETALDGSRDVRREDKLVAHLVVPLFLLTEVALAKGDLFGRGVARECSAEKRVHQRGLVGRIVRQKFPREIAGLAGDEIAVEQRQRLRGDSGHRTSTNRTLGSAVVEHLEKRYHHRPLHEGVNAAARLLIGPGVAPAAARLGGAGDHFAAEVRIKSAAAHRGVERVAGPENGIANGLGLETAKVLAPDQLVAGIGILVHRILP